jgi:SET domain-containing protein
MQLRSRRQNDASSPREKGPLILRDVAEKGRGVFASKPFPKGAEVLQFLGDVRDVSEFSDLTHALQIGPREFLSASGGIDDYVNHSCQPNCGIRDDEGRIILVALRPISRNEEISFDYSTTQSGGFWTMECQCGAPGCRTRIGDFKDLPPALRDYYIRENAVLPFLLLKDAMP